MSQVITIDDLTTYMPSTTLDAGTAQIIVDGANSWVETQTGRCFGETKQVAERYDWKNNVWLRHMDVISIDDVTVGFPNQTQSTLDAAGYYFNPLGRLTILGWTDNTAYSRYSDLLSVEYTYGYHVLGFQENETTPIVPDDLKQAVLGIAAGFYNWAINGQRDIASVQVGSYQIAYTNKRTSAGSTPDEATSTSDANWAVISSYKLRRQ